MYQLKDYPARVENIFGDEQTPQGCLTNIKPVVPWVEASAHLFSDVAIGQIEINFFHYERCIPPYHLHWLRQALPGYRCPQNIVAINHSLKCFYISIKTLATISAE
jgi:hypothetical protein